MEALYKHIETTYESFIGRKHDVAAAASGREDGAETCTSSPKLCAVGQQNESQADVTHETFCQLPIDVSNT